MPITTGCFAEARVACSLRSPPSRVGQQPPADIAESLSSSTSGSGSAARCSGSEVGSTTGWSASRRARRDGRPHDPTPRAAQRLREQLEFVAAIIEQLLGDAVAVFDDRPEPVHSRVGRRSGWSPVAISRPKKTLPLSPVKIGPARHAELTHHPWRVFRRLRSLLTPLVVPSRRSTSSQEVAASDLDCFDVYGSRSSGPLPAAAS